jgi:membrane-bound metal-dependent hydrolase YbcI (DUF457 family)
MIAAGLLTGALLPAREGDFQALWYYGIIALGMALLVSAASYYTLRAVRPLWRGGEQPVALLIVTVTGFLIVMLLAMATVAVIGLGNHPGTGPG